MQLFDERLRKIHQASLIFCCVCVLMFFLFDGGVEGEKDGDLRDLPVDFQCCRG